MASVNLLKQFQPIGYNNNNNNNNITVIIILLTLVLSLLFSE